MCVFFSNQLNKFEHQVVKATDAPQKGESGRVNLATICDTACNRVTIKSFRNAADLSADALLAGSNVHDHQCRVSPGPENEGASTATQLASHLAAQLATLPLPLAPLSW